MLFRLRHFLVFLLFVFLPFHALFVTLGTKLLFGSGHAPHALLALWKEILMALIFLVAIAELFTSDRAIIKRILNGEKWKWRISLEKRLILALLLLAFVIQFFIIHSSLFTPSFIYGFKYFFVPLIFFAVLATLPWEEGFLERRVMPVLMIIGGIVALYGIITFFPPPSFFTALGYSDAHSLYVPGSPLAAFQQISGTGIRRIQSTFSGPNQLGLWLLIPWSIGMVRLLSSSEARRAESRGGSGLSTRFASRISLEKSTLLFLIAFALLLTFSRSAWIAAFIITLVAMGIMLKGRARVMGFSSLVTGALIALVLISVAAPSLINRAISNRHHLERLQEGMQMMIRNPLGLGLGSAGPASNRTSDACVYFKEGADTSWAKDRSDLCLFVNDVQVQPSVDQRACRCPILPENWYVQVGIELGVLGFLLFLAFILSILRRLHSMQSLPTLLAFLGVSTAALFLHAWEDSAVAYTVWGLVGIGYTRVSNNRITD